MPRSRTERYSIDRQGCSMPRTRMLVISLLSGAAGAVVFFAYLYGSGTGSASDSAKVGLLIGIAIMLGVLLALLVTVDKN